MLIMRPGLGITRVRFNGYNLSPRTASPLRNSTAKVMIVRGNTKFICPGPPRPE